MTIDRESIAKRLPPHFNVQIDGDVISFTTTHEGKAYELMVTGPSGAFADVRIEAAIECCHRFNEEHGR